MQVSEFHFNIKKREGLAFDTFVYEPTNVYEKRAGSLYIAGELRNVLPQNIRLLDNLTSTIKEKYYALSSRTAEQAMVEGLKNANKFLELVAKSGNVSWLGNLNYAVLGVKGPNFKVGNIQQYELNLAKVGSIKTLLVRQNQLIDMGKNIDIQGFEPYPLKIFGNIVSGELVYEDIVLALTKEVYSFFDSQGILKEILKEEDFDPEKLNKILKSKNLTGLNGACLLISMKEAGDKNQKSKSITFQKEPEKISIFKSLMIVFSFIIKVLLFVKNNIFRLVKRISSAIRVINARAKARIEVKKQEEIMKKVEEDAELAEKTEQGEEIEELEENGDETEKLEIKEKAVSFIEVQKTEITAKNAIAIPISRAKTKPVFSFNLPKIKLPRISFPKIVLSNNLKNNLYLIFALAGFLMLGFFVFRLQEQQKIKQSQSALSSIQNEINQAEQLMRTGNDKSAYPILTKSLQEINNIQLATNDPLKNEATSLKNSVENDLKTISKFVNIVSPKILFRFNADQFVPQKMVIFQNDLYLFSPFSNDIHKLTPSGGDTVIQTDKRFSIATPYNNSILFLQKPNIIYQLTNDSFGDPLTLTLPSSDFTIDSFAAFNSNLYVLDGKKGEVIKYPGPIDQGKDKPQTWLKDPSKKPIDSQSISVDGSVWVLDKDNSITYFFAGDFQETLSMEIYPPIKIFQKILAPAQLPYIYILEPVQKRLILFAKSNFVVKQYFSDKFDNLKDFGVSEDGREIYVLNGTKIYQIDY